jgi:hypothetical protein
MNVVPEEGIDILGQAIEATLIKLIALNAGTFISGAVFGFLAGRGGKGEYTKGRPRKRTGTSKRAG